MLSEQLQNTYRGIVSEAVKMVSTHVEPTDLTGNIDYASIYAQSPEQFDAISQALNASGTVALERTSGDYYQLNEPLVTPDVTIQHCRVRVFDHEHPERGYVDFGVVDYEVFKKKYLGRPGFTVITTGEEMVELRDPSFDVRAYFPSNF